MKFDLSESVTGADLCPNAVILSFSRDIFGGVLAALEPLDLLPDAFAVQGEQVTMAVILPEDATEGQRCFPAGVRVEEDCFRLILRGRRLKESSGLGGLWESVLAKEAIPVLFSCSDAMGITQYLPLRARPAVLTLLNRTFGICVV